ncbi:MAG: hypothetical protein RLY31_867 [Bacteroidota bacterium]|jgi:murein DD-endopeptidase MepM/ murein hydrolase activator NlpD
MSDEIGEKVGRMDRLRYTYRLVIYKDETFEEVGSYRLSLLNVYTMLSTFVVLIAVLIILLISFTPIKRFLPGYVGTRTHLEMLKLYEDLDSLSALVDAQDVYNQGFRRMLTGEVQEPTGKRPQRAKEQETLALGERSEVDEQLREEIEREQASPSVGKPAAATKPVNISPRDIPLEQMYFTTPVSGTVVAAFDPEKNHIGVDVIAPKHTPVKAVMDGWVIASDWTLETGNTIAIQHSNDLVTFYKHNSALLKRTGSYVRAGEAIAIIGNTGELTDGPHLHFELWHQGKPINPTDFVYFR